MISGLSATLRGGHDASWRATRAGRGGEFRHLPMPAFRPAPQAGPFIHSRSQDSSPSRGHLPYPSHTLPIPPEPGTQGVPWGILHRGGLTCKPSSPSAERRPFLDPRGDLFFVRERLLVCFPGSQGGETTAPTLGIPSLRDTPGRSVWPRDGLRLSVTTLRDALRRAAMLRDAPQVGTLHDVRRCFATLRGAR